MWGARDRILAWLARRINAPLLVTALILSAVAAVSSSPYGLRLMTLAGIYALLVIGYQFIFGHAGALSLAQGTFFGLGAYVTGILGSAADSGFVVSFPASLIVPVLLALLVAAPVLRLQSHYFALATLGIAQVMLLVAVSWQGVTGGANGLTGVPGIVVLGTAVPRGLPLLVIVWAIVAAGALIAWQATRGVWGQALLVLRTDPVAAAAIGIDGGALRFAAFLMSALYAGGAGALYAHTMRIISPEMLEFPVMVACLTMAMVGGRARVSGAILGAVLLVHLPEWLRVLGASYLIAYGIALLAVIVLAPGGIVGGFETLRNRLSPPAPQAPPCARSPPAPLPAPTGSKVTALEVRDITKRYGGIEALAGVSLALAYGEILGLIGPNGSGKTTLLNLVAGLDRVDSGTIYLNRVAITGKRPHEIARLGVGRSFQTSRIVEAMSPLEAVALAWTASRRDISLRRSLARSEGSERHEAQGIAMHYLALLGAASVATQPCGDLTLVMRRRVEIAGAVARQPRVLLLDEPAAGLTEPEQGDLARRLAAIVEGGLGLVIIEHNMGFLMPLAHRIVCLERGRVIAAGPPHAISRDRRVVAAYLGEPEATEQNGDNTSGGAR